MILANPTLRLFIGAALISLSPVWVKLVSVSPTTSGFYRVFIGGSALALYLAISRQRLELSRRTWQILLLAASWHDQKPSGPDSLRGVARPQGARR